MDVASVKDEFRKTVEYKGFSIEFIIPGNIKNYIDKTGFDLEVYLTDTKSWFLEYLFEILDWDRDGVPDREFGSEFKVLIYGVVDKIIEIPPPDEKTREEIFKIHAKKMPLLKGVSFGDLAAKTEGYTGADIENACREAGMVAIRKEAEGVSTADFDEALTHIKPSISKEYVERIKRFAKGSHDSMFR